MTIIDLIRDLSNRIKALEPCDSEDIFFTKGANGFSAHLQNINNYLSTQNVNSNYYYSGYFAVTQYLPPDDGSDPDADTLAVAVSAGRCLITTTDYEVVAKEKLEVTGDGYVYLEANGAAAPTIKFAKDFPTYEEGKFKALLAEVKLNDDGDAIKSITQQSYGMIRGVIWTSSCSSTETAS